MPVFAEWHITPTDTLSTEDRTDLEKIYADHPGLPDSRAWLAAQLDEPGVILGARFNGRLLGAARLRAIEQGWQLSDLCVRALTRQRTVASQLLHQALRLPQLKSCALRLELPAEHAYLQPLLERLGFQADAQGWLRQPNH